MNSLEVQHSLDVVKLASQVRDFYKSRTKFRIYHGGTNSTRAQRFELGKTLDTGGLNRIIEINVEKRYAIVEPSVSMGELVEETLKKGLIPSVVMEFPEITVGGGVQGGAGESSSFRYGLFHECCEEYDLILGDGETVRASRTLNPDLFWGTACSYGTLGVLVQVKVRLIPAKKYVRIKYTKVEGGNLALDLIGGYVKKDLDFLDGILFSSTSGVVMEGSLSDGANLPVETFSKVSDEWFYLHAKQVIQKQPVFEELIPLKDYLFRYNRAAFWAGKYVFSRFHLPMLRVIRTILNPFLTTKRLYRILHATNISQQYIIQDISVPKEKAVQFLEYIDTQLHIFPLWICPLRTEEKACLAPNFIKTDLAINVGIWGETKKGFSKFLQTNRDLEEFTENIGGRKVLYAHTYYPEEEFWKIYDKDWYEELRKKYKAEVVFPTIFEKVYVQGRYVSTVGRGLIKLVRNKLAKSFHFAPNDEA